MADTDENGLSYKKVKNSYKRIQTKTLPHRQTQGSKMGREAGYSPGFHELNLIGYLLYRIPLPDLTLPVLICQEIITSYAMEIFSLNTLCLG
jgi:hypothetical protein